MPETMVEKKDKNTLHLLHLQQEQGRFVLLFCHCSIVGSLLVYFHPCLVLVLTTGPPLHEMHYCSNLPSVSAALRGGYKPTFKYIPFRETCSHYTTHLRVRMQGICEYIPGEERILLEINAFGAGDECVRDRRRTDGGENVYCCRQSLSIGWLERKAFNTGEESV